MRPAAGPDHCPPSTSLRLVVQGHELREYPAFGHRETVNRGHHRLLTGGRYDAFLATPVVERTS